MSESIYQSRHTGEEIDAAVDTVASLYNNKELIFSTHEEFPNIGDVEKLYIATDENAIYRFDGDLNIYKKIKSGLDVDSIQSKLTEV